MCIVHLCLSKAGFGGLEIQMADRVLDNLNNGYESVLVCLGNSPLYQYAIEKGIPVETIQNRLPYLDPVSIYQLSELFRRLDVRLCLVG
ncbi:MAG: hypothetical protein NTX15_11370, partial [Candidatus Kapabacteria bacterium]|nr:hypothetical protein [Candidatus Kapabacteria bacterium]